jgi:hypothetical protein
VGAHPSRFWFSEGWALLNLSRCAFTTQSDAKTPFQFAKHLDALLIGFGFGVAVAIWGAALSPQARVRN